MGWLPELRPFLQLCQDLDGATTGRGIRGLLKLLANNIAPTLRTVRFKFLFKYVQICLSNTAVSARLGTFFGIQSPQSYCPLWFDIPGDNGNF